MQVHFVATVYVALAFALLLKLVQKVASIQSLKLFLRASKDKFKPVCTKYSTKFKQVLILTSIPTVQNAISDLPISYVIRLLITQMLII